MIKSAMWFGPTTKKVCRAPSKKHSCPVPFCWTIKKINRNIKS